MAAFAPVAPDQTFATYEELLDAMTLDSEGVGDPARSRRWGQQSRRSR